VKPVVIHPAGNLELAESATYYELRRPGLGREFKSAMNDAVLLIQQSPQRNSVRRDGSRRYVVQRFPFNIHYLELADYIWIVAFAHGSRKPGYWRNRLD